MQPSEYEIQQEVEALRDIRRRSTAGGPGSLMLDPDLPNPSSPTSQVPYWSPTDDSSSSSHEDGSDSSHVSAQDDPFHLFWVPARLHPEIAPAEFRAFLKEHARAPVDEVGVLGPSSSVSSSDSLSRKKSMLSRQYKPSANDGVEDEHVVPIRRNRTSVYANSGPQLTISDLQKLEELAEEASESDDPSRLRSVLRRSLSLNVAPSVIDQMDDMPDMGDDADSPIIVPRPGQILRRAARTKIRKPGQTGEGAHRFTATRSRRKSVARAATLPPQEPRTSSDMSSSDHGDGELSRAEVSRKADVPEMPEVPRFRPESYSEESSIYDAYATDESEDVEPSTSIKTPEPAPSFISPSPLVIPPSHPPEPVPEPVPEAPVPPVLHHPQPQHVAPPPIAAPIVQPRSPSPEPPSPSRTTESTPEPRTSISQSRPSLQSTTPYTPTSSPPEQHRREKDKKGLFGKWGSDKGSKKHHKEKEAREREKEKESGFFGSLFGSKKKQEESPPSLVSSNGRETAAALLGASKSSKNYVPPPSPQLANAYARYPIHVERAIYRLSHIKLANPRRPLYEQVLISNLMFWYLGVINKQQQQSQPQPNGTPAQAASASADNEQGEREQKERDERERAEKERAEKEQVEQQKESSRRGSLTKASGAGTPAPGGRRAEMPVRSPQYDMQHRAMEQEYGYGSPGNVPGGASGRPSSAPAAPNGYPAASSSRTSSSAPSPYTVQLVQPQPQTANNRYYNDMSQGQQYPTVNQPAQLPPGAMSPAAVEQTWLSSTGSSPPVARNHTSPSPPPRNASPPSAAQGSPRRARSPPAGNRYTPAQEKQPYSGQRLPGRSLSASAVPPVPPLPQINGKVKKGVSAHAVVPHRHSEDEDVPLAVWQQQQRRK